MATKNNTERESAYLKRFAEWKESKKKKEDGKMANAKNRPTVCRVSNRTQVDNKSCRRPDSKNQQLLQPKTADTDLKKQSNLSQSSTTDKTRIKTVHSKTSQALADSKSKENKDVKNIKRVNDLKTVVKAIRPTYSAIKSSGYGKMASVKDPESKVKKSGVTSTNISGSVKSVGRKDNKNTELVKNKTLIKKRHSRSKSMGVLARPATSAITKTEHKTPQSSQKLHVHFVSPTRESSRIKSVRKKNVEQLSLRNNLNEWLKSKGKTPNRYNHLMCFGAHVSAKKKQQIAKRGLSVDELSKQESHVRTENIQRNLESELTEAETEQKTLISSCEQPSFEPIVITRTAEDYDDILMKSEEMMDECMKLYKAGCPSENVLQWLEEMGNEIPSLKSVAHYWLNRIKIIAECPDKTDNHVLAEFELAITHGAKPGEKMASALREFVLNMKDDCKTSKGVIDQPGTPVQSKDDDLVYKTPQTSRRSDGLNKQNIFESSSIKYTVAENTPLLKRMRMCHSPSNIPSAVVTPVRRSTRKSTGMLPKMFHDHEIIVDSLNDLQHSHKTNAVFQSNPVLETH